MINYHQIVMEYLGDFYYDSAELGVVIEEAYEHEIDWENEQDIRYSFLLAKHTKIILDKHNLPVEGNFAAVYKELDKEVRIRLDLLYNTIPNILQSEEDYDFAGDENDCENYNAIVNAPEYTRVVGRD